MTINHHVTPIKLDYDEKFNGENWATFKMAMRTKGNICSLINYWENKVAIPGNMLAPLLATPINSLSLNLLKYAQHESVVLAWIIHNIKDIFGVEIDPHKPSHMAWDVLTTQYGTYSDLIRNQREKMLEVVKYQGEKVSSDGGYIERMQKLQKEANNAGTGINDQSFKTTLLNSFHESWDSVISALYTKKNLTVVIACLIAHGKWVVRWNSMNNPSSTQESTVQALQASIQVLTLQIQSLSLKRTTAPRFDKSHTANKNCKELGHTPDKCWKLGGGRQGQYPIWWRGKQDTPLLNSANLTTANAPPSKPGSIYTNITTLAAHVNDETLKHIEGILETEEPALMVNNTSAVDTSLLYEDSGALTHFIQNRECFFHYLPLGETSGTSSKAGMSLKIHGVGTVALKSSILGIQNMFTLSISANLISISRLDKEGWFVTFGGGQATFVD